MDKYTVQQYDASGRYCVDGPRMRSGDCMINCSICESKDIADTAASIANIAYRAGYEERWDRQTTAFYKHAASWGLYYWSAGMNT